jgi:dsRNA-specific ribonuclease
MSQQLDELERRIGYHFHNRDYLRRALTCQSAINEHHPDATEQNFKNFEFIGDAVLKYVVATLLYNQQSEFQSSGVLHDRVCSFISNSNLSRIGHELDLSEYIIRGKGVFNITEKMLAEAVEAILGAIVIDQQQQGNSSENVLFNVIARVFAIPRNGRSIPIPPRQNNDNTKRCSCCKCICIILMLLVLAIITLFVLDRVEL